MGNFGSILGMLPVGHSGRAAWEDKAKANGERMLKFALLRSKQLMAPNGRSECDTPDFSGQRAACQDFSTLDYILINRGAHRSKVTCECDMCRFNRSLPQMGKHRPN